MEDNRRKFLKSLAGLGGLAATAVPGISTAAADTKANIQDIRLSNNKRYVRLVFDLDKLW